MIAAILKRLEDAQTELARAAILQPAQRDLFEYGRVHGVMAGLEQAKTLLFEIEREDKERDRKL